jgi:hypothetical protein
MIFNNMKTFNNKLTTRQHRLADLLDEEYDKDQNKWLESKYVYDEMQYRAEKDEEYYPYLRKNVTWNNQPGRRQLTADLEALKRDDVRQGVYISSEKGMKRANKQEANQVLKSEQESILKSLNRNIFQIKKIGLDNQVRLVFNYEKGIYEVF